MTDTLEAEAPPLVCPDCGAEAKSPAGLASHQRTKHPGQDGEAAGSDAPRKGGSWLGRLWNREPKNEKLRRPARPGLKRKRVPTDSLFEAPFSFGADAAGAAGYRATANMLAAEAPWAGHVLDEAIEGTLIDRLVQPIARAEDRFMMAGSVLGPPLICLMLDRTTTPERRRQYKRSLAMVLREQAPYMARGMARKKVRDEEIQRAFAEMTPALADVDPRILIEQMVEEIAGPDNLGTSEAAATEGENLVSVE